jgi:hypothetical protein
MLAANSALGLHDSLAMVGQKVSNVLTLLGSSPLKPCVILYALQGQEKFRGGAEHFVGEISRLRKVAKFSPRRNFCGM